MKERTYNYLYHRVEYPRERGYRMEQFKLPPYILVDIFEDGSSKKVRVRSRIHINKEVVLPTSYSLEFRDAEILVDVSGKIAHMYSL